MNRSDPMSMQYDPFRPHQQPAQTIYDAFQSEATHRRQRTLDEWIRLEREAVHRSACQHAEHYGLTKPSMQDVEEAERYARGSADYGAKWAYGVASKMTGR